MTVDPAVSEAADNHVGHSGPDTNLIRISNWESFVIGARWAYGHPRGDVSADRADGGVSVKRVSDRVVWISDGLNVVRVGPGDIDAVADALALYADMCPCGNGMCLGCEMSEPTTTDPQ